MKPSKQKEPKKKPTAKKQKVVKSTSMAISGGPAEYDEGFPNKIALLTWQRGRKLTRAELAVELGCHQLTIEKWIKKHPKFAAAIKRPMEEIHQLVGYQAIKAATIGRTETKDGPGGVEIKTIEPTPKDIAAIQSLNLINAKKLAAREDAETMREHVRKYRAKEISIAELIDAYVFEGCKVPAHLQEEHKMILKQEAAQEVVESLSDKDQEIVNAALDRLGLL